MEKRKPLQKMVLGKLESHMQKNETRSQFVPIYKTLIQKWIKDINIRSETINYVEENIGTKLMDLSRTEHFMNWTTRAREVKAKNK